MVTDDGGKKPDIMGRVLSCDLRKTPCLSRRQPARLSKYPLTLCVVCYIVMPGIIGILY